MLSEPFAPFLAAQGVVILDGALATELERRGANIADALWSARVLLDDPDRVATLHRDYFLAGADVAITATYQASFSGFARAGIGRPAAAQAMRDAVALAIGARDAVCCDPRFAVGRQRPLVAASIGPYGAALADGSEYRGDYGIGVDALVAWHAERFALLADSGADLLACETMPCADEVRALLRLLDAHPAARAWISCQARDGAHLASGEPFTPVMELAAAHPQVIAVGVNCTAPAHVCSLVRLARVASAKPVLAYPNAGDRWDAAARRWIALPSGHGLSEMAPEWLAAGAQVLGGCCGTGPAEISALREALLA